MEREVSSSRYGVLRSRQQGAAIVEAVIALPILLAIILGAIQFGLIYQAKATLNFAALQAARAGAVSNARPDAMRSGLARGLAPLYSPESSLAGVASTVARLEAALVQDARIRILNPTREAFEDFGEEVEGVREIPNDRLHARSTSIGALSGVNIQDANLLRVEITYGHELSVPLVNWFISRVLLSTRRAGRGMDAFEQQLLRRGRLPIVTTSTVRMQSPARMSDAVVARGDLPDVDRIPADARPPDDVEEGEGDEEEEESGESESGAGSGSNLGDGFLGFGGGSGNGSGGGVTPGNGGGGSGSGGGGNSGSPAQCPGTGGGSSPFPPNPSPPGDSSPVPPGPSPFPFPIASNNGGEGAALPTIELPALSVGNPIHVVTGNKYQKEVDLAALPGPLGLSFARHYNSEAVGRSGVMGAGWRHSYEASVEPGPDEDHLYLWQADGRRLAFARTAQSNQFLAQRASDGHVEKSATGYTWRWTSGRTLRFDADGRLAEISERGSSLVLHYANARLERVVDAQRRQLHFEYYANGRVSAIRTVAGMSWHYSYDSVGNLATVMAASGRARRYDYDDERHPHHLTDLSAGTLRLAAYGAQKALIPLAHWEYDEDGRGVLSSHPENAGKVQLRYSTGFTDVTDAFGRVTRYVSEVRNGVALVTEVRGPGCGACGVGDVAYGFNESFQVAQVLVRGVPPHRYQYDKQRRLISVERERGSNHQLVARYSYDGDSLQPRLVERPSIRPGTVRSIEIEYTSGGAPSRISERGFSPSAAGFREIQRTYRLGYGVNGSLSTIDGPREDVADLTKFEYDELGRLTAVRSATGGVTLFRDFDAAGRHRIIRPPGSFERRIDYDLEGRITRSTELRAAGPRTWNYTYDDAGRLAKIVDADGRVQHLGYDAAGRPNRFALDDSGIAGALKYAPDGNVVGAAILMPGNAQLRTFLYIYDQQRRLIEVRDGDGPPLHQITYAGDDPRPLRVIDPLGNPTELSYSSDGAVRSVLAPDGGMTWLSRDPDQRMEEVIAPNGSRTRYHYDDFGQRIRDESVDTGVTEYSYDPAGNLILKRDANGKDSRFDYDADNRLIRTHRGEGTTNFYFESTRIARIVSRGQSERFEYDADGHSVKHERRIAGRGFFTAHTYDADGRISTRTMPSGQRLRYHHTEKGVLRAITRDGLLRSDVIVDNPIDSPARVDAMGRMAYGNGIGLENRYDGQTGYLQRRSMLGLAAFSYKYDEAGQVVSISDGRNPRSFDYDANGRLVSARVPAGAFRYQYDTNGNRVATEVTRTNSARNSLTYTAGSNRLASDAEYDSTGNPIRSGNRRYDYNNDGRPIRLYMNGKLAATYAYNSAGERVSKTLHMESQPQTTLYLYENHQLIAEADEKGRVTREYVYLGTHPVAILEPNAIYWVHTDHLGTPVAVTDRLRQVVWRAEHEPFGLARVNEDPDADGNRLTLNLRFPGQYADSESGTHYNMMRDYDPQTGRYLTPDPLGLYAGTNVYAYAQANPVSKFDALGLYDAYVHFYMTYFLALVAGIPPDIAETIATATQYIDENAQTSPIAGGILSNALPRYHFTLDYGNGSHGDRSADPTTRFYSPASQQLTNLYQITTVPVLERLWDEAHPPAPYSCPVRRIEDARYQLFGEYLHAYEDTFAHRDTRNLAYDLFSFNDDNDPGAIVGHVGLNVPDNSHAPDHSYNQEYTAPSQCRVLSDQTVRGHPLYETRSGLSEQQCRDARGEYTPERRSVWAYNELRTLRMEYEVLNLLRSNFDAEIRSNIAAGARSYSWMDIAGTRGWDPAGARSGHSSDLPVVAVLQRFNSAPDGQKWGILNDWLIDRGFAEMPRLRATTGGLSSPLAASIARQQNLDWLPRRAEQEFNVLLPRPIPAPDPGID